MGAKFKGVPAGGGLESFQGGNPPIAMKPITPIINARFCLGFKTTMKTYCQKELAKPIGLQLINTNAFEQARMTKLTCQQVCSRNG